MPIDYSYIFVLIRYMYWTDWSASEPRIVRAWMDGSNYNVIVNGSWVHWPNGITIDYRTDKIYWTDAYHHAIYSADSDGKNSRSVKYGSFYVPHPYSIGIFKVCCLPFQWPLLFQECYIFPHILLHVAILHCYVYLSKYIDIYCFSSIDFYSLFVYLLIP